MTAHSNDDRPTIHGLVAQACRGDDPAPELSSDIGIRATQLWTDLEGLEAQARAGESAAYLAARLSILVDAADELAWSAEALAGYHRARTETGL